MRISLHIDIINACFKDIENLGGLVLFSVFLCKMREMWLITCRMVPYYGNNLEYNNIPKNK